MPITGLSGALAAIAAAYARGAADDDAPDRLARLYPEAPLLRAADRVYPVAVWPTPAGPPDERLAFIEAVESGPPEAPVAADATYRQLLEGAGVGLFDGRCYTLRRGDGDATGLRLEYGRGGYFAALDTGEAYALELYRALGAGRLRDTAGHRALLEALPLRRALHAAVADPLRDGRGRCAAMAVATLVAFRARGAWWGLLRRCASPGNARVDGRVHVLPSGMLQPRSPHESGPSVARTVYTELLEELFGRSEADATQAVDGRGDPALAALDEAGARLDLIGLAVDLATLRPELVTVLTIPDERWAERVAFEPSLRYTPNDEWGASVGAPDAPLGGVPLEGDEAGLAERWGLLPHTMVAPAAAAFFLGRRRVLE